MHCQSKTMRVGIIGDALDRQYAGIHYFTKNLIRYLLIHDPDNEYFLFREKKGTEGFDCVEIVVPSRRNIPAYQSARLFWMIPKEAQKRGINVMIEPAHFGPFNLPQTIKRVTVIHDLTPILFRKWHTFNGWFLQKLFLPQIIRNADLIITNSEYTKTDIVKHIGKEASRIVPVHLGISELFKPTIDKEVLAKYGIVKEYILYQGTLEPRKNLINLISAYELYRDRFPNSSEQLILSGKKGWKIKEVISKKYSSRYRDDIILLGYIDRNDMPIIYSSATVFAYPSYYEGFGLPVLEAMACGTPIVTSNSSSLPEVAQEHAIYFNPEDILALSNALNEAKFVTPEKREKQIAHANSFSWGTTATNIINAINSLDI